MGYAESTGGGMSAPTYCPIMAGRICLDDEVCDSHCVNFLCACEECDAAGTNNSYGFTLHDDGRTLCESCQSLFEAEKVNNEVYA